MRVYPSEENWPDSPREAHKLLINAYWHLKNRDHKFDTLPAREVLGEPINVLNEELQEEVSW